MRWRVLFLASLVVNLVLAAGWIFSAHRHSASRNPSESSVGSATIKTNVLIRRQFFSWSEIESADYPTYVKNLRDIGCPEQTIRDIIIADVNALFAKRIATDPDITAPGQEWWRSEPDANLVAVAEKRLQVLETERRTLLAQLLGPDWEGGDLANIARPSRAAVVLDGPMLGNMPTDVKQSVEEISARANERLQAYLDVERAAGRTPDPAQIAKLREETRTELSHVLTPPQLEEFLLRYSQEASSLRSELGDLKYFDASPDEFRAIFRATDSIDQQLEMLAGKTDANSVLQRNQLEQQRDAAIKTALGANRYAEFQMLHDPQYRSAVATAEEAGTPDAANQIYLINLAATQQLAAISANTNFTADQKLIAQKQLELDQLKANALALGQELPPEETNAAPATATPPPFVPATHSYVLGLAETAIGVATRYGVSLVALQAANPGVDLRRLKPGDSIQIPGPMWTPTQPPPPMQ
jgi:LysM repeat protein